MPNSRQVALTAFGGLVLALPATCAFASKEGGALAEVILWGIAIVLVAFVAFVIGGGALGAFRASQSGDSMLKGGARGLVKGLIEFVVVAAWAMVGLTVLSFLWVAFSFLYVYVLNPDAGT